MGMTTTAKPSTRHVLGIGLVGTAIDTLSIDALAGMRADR